MSIEGQAPQPAQSGRILTKSSIPGQNLVYVAHGFAQSSTGVTVDIIGSPNERGSLTANLNVTVDGKTQAVTKIFFKTMSNIFIDNTTQDFDYEHIVGANVAGTGLEDLIIARYDPSSPNSGNSARVIWQVNNLDVDAHTVYFWPLWKVFITQDPQ